MNLATKVSLFFTSLAVALIVVLMAISLYSFRSFSLNAATEHIRTAAEMVRVDLTESMINGVIDKRENFLKRLMEVQGLKSARVVRGPLVQQQFGKGLAQEAAKDEIELQVLQTGIAAYDLIEGNGETIFRGTIPFIASSHGSPNCLNCHQVPEGTVLGAVTMTMSIDYMKERALITVGGIVGAVTLFVLAMVFLLRRLMRPVADTANNVEHAVQEALKGNFKTQVVQHTNDEVCQIATDMNRLLAFLDDGLHRIGSRVALLTNRTPADDENLLTATIDQVEGLTKAAHFKQAIEEDETKGEIYRRLADTLQKEFRIDEYSIYELAGPKNQMVPMIVDGAEEASCRWCDPQILVRPEACRARRTGHVVDALRTPGLCVAFNPPEDTPRTHHLCFPIMQSGAVGSVLQLVVQDHDKDKLKEQEPYVQVFLREAAPVLEAKRLMETLRESNLRDPMTGLNNRRFLEEYVETLISGAQRRNAHLCILMLDLDYFKMVNDTYGHDAGDTVLKALSKILRQAVRSSDMVIRYGGEEFLIILQDTTAADGERVAENIRLSVEQMKIPVGTTTLNKTISIGVADFPGDSDTFWQTVKFADVALYRAKESGRNQVVRFKSDMWTDTTHAY